MDENKLILTLISYINYERNYHILDFQYRNYFGDSNSAVSSYRSNSASSNALRCISQILKIWDLLPNTRKPMLAMYYQQESFGLRASDEILSQALIQPEQAIFLLECLTLCIDFQAGFLNSISKDENFSSVISNTFYLNINAIATRASGD